MKLALWRVKVTSFPCSLRLALPSDSRTHHLFRAWPASPIQTSDVAPSSSFLSYKPVVALWSTSHPSTSQGVEMGESKESGPIFAY